MNCVTCDHEEHDVARCKQCNCGESEVSRGLSAYVHRMDADYSDWLLSIREHRKRGALWRERNYRC